MMVSFIQNTELLAANMRTVLPQQVYNIIAVLMHVPIHLSDNSSGLTSYRCVMILKNITVY